MNKSTLLTPFMFVLAVGASFGPMSWAADQAVSLRIATKGEELAFDKTVLTVKAGQKVKLSFKNNSGMQHNWVLTKPGSADEVMTASMAAGADKNWLAVGPAVLAHTPLVNAKQTVTYEFQAPATAGDYPFLCTFPGHGSLMRGTLKVK